MFFLTGSANNCEELAGHDCAGDTVNNLLCLLEHSFALAPSSRGLCSNVDVFPRKLDLHLCNLVGLEGFLSDDKFC